VARQRAGPENLGLIPTAGEGNILFSKTYNLAVGHIFSFPTDTMESFSGNKATGM
jgi:hypothetical protein